MAFHTPHGSARYRLPWSWSAFDYRELCELLWAQCGDARFEIAKVERPRRGDDRRTPTAATLHGAADRRRARLAPRARPGADVQPPEAPISRGLEVHPARRRRRRPRRLDRPLARPPRLRLVGARRRRAARRRRLLRAARPRQGADARDRRAARRRRRPLPGQLVPAPRCAPAAEDGVFFVGDSAGPLLPALGRGHPHRVLLRHRLRARAARRARRASSTREQALARYGAFSRRPRAAPSACALRLQRLIPALPPRALTRAAARVMRRAQRPRADRAFGWYLRPGAPAFATPRSPRERPTNRVALAHCLISAAWRSPTTSAASCPCVIQDWRTRRGADARLHERRGARAHARDRRAAPLEPLARRAVAQGRDVGQHAGASRRCASTATATRVLALVEPAGPACHTGERTCFHNGDLEPPAPHEALPGARAHARRARAPSAPRAPTRSSCSPTRRCIGEKVQEEAEEVARAAREETDERVAEEAADVLYHLDRAAAQRAGCALADAEEVLDGRRR